MKLLRNVVIAVCLGLVIMQTSFAMKTQAKKTSSKKVEKVKEEPKEKENPVDVMNQYGGRGWSLRDITNALNKLLQDPNLDFSEKNKDGINFLSFMLNAAAGSEHALVSAYQPYSDALQTILNRPNIDFNDADLKTWQNFIQHHIIKDIDSGDSHFDFLNNIKLDLFIYKNFGNEEWLQKSDIYPLVKLVNALISKGIEKSTAVDFLKIDQNKPQDVKTFKDKNLALIEEAYLIAKYHDLTQLGSFIRRYMTTMANTPQDIGGIIAPFEPAEHPLVSPKKKQKVQTKKIKK